MPTSIANTEPGEFKGRINRLPFFVPSWKEVNLWKTSPKTKEDWEHFVAMYRIVCRDRWGEIARWLDLLKPEGDLTLLCWERTSDRCHRSLVAKFVEVYRPDCYGGLDVQNPYRKCYRHKAVEYRIQAVAMPWCEGYGFSLSKGEAAIEIGNSPDLRHLKSPWDSPDGAISGAIEFLKTTNKNQLKSQLLAIDTPAPKSAN